jgi:excinuclease ABC subunit C
MLNIKAFLNTLTSQPGVYQMLDQAGEILYIGKARNLKKRVASYFSSAPKDTKTAALLTHINDINIIVTHSENDALLLECNLIKKHRPYYNVLFRDDKSYPYILISDEQPYPCIDFYRGDKKTPGKYFGPYPNSVAVRETIHLIQKLFGLRIRSDRYHPNRARPCLRYQIHMCSGSCASLISPEDYARDVQHAILFLQGKNTEVINTLTKRMEEASTQLNYELAGQCRDQITKLREIQARQYVSADHGEADVIGFCSGAGATCLQLLLVRGGRILGSRAYFPSVPADAIPEEILTSFITQHYLGTPKKPQDFPKEIILSTTLPEQNWLAAALSEAAGHKIILSSTTRTSKKKWLDMANNSAKQSIATHMFDKMNMQKRFMALRDAFHLKTLPKRIECFDISHSMGEATVGACVVFNNQGPMKSDYRRFNINDVTPGDDVAAIRQTLLRRYKRLQAEHTKLPEVILIDGGPTQLNAAESVCAELDMQHVTLLGVAKGSSRKPGLEKLFLSGHKPLSLPADSLALHLIQQIRDEAHRFAITGHRQRRDKKRRTSTLEEITGIGAKRRRDLLRYFGGIQAINRASLDELARVPGISRALAERIFATLHNTI